MAEDTAPLGGGYSSAAARAPSSFVKKGDRQMFTVELRPGETTIVSWKKLMKDANKVNNKGPASAPEYLPNANPALESRIAPGQPKETEGQAPPQPNRFSAVIEKIERLYMGKDSSDEEDLLDVPDDQYDTEDSFIDDTELDEYFEVDNSAIKHDGFFVNRGKLERINEPPALPIQQAKKRRRKDISKNPREKIDGHVSNKHVRVCKTVAGKNTLNSSHNLGVPGEHYEDMKFEKQLDASRISLEKKTADTRPLSDPPVCIKLSNNDPPAAEGADKQKTGVLQSKDTSNKFKDTSGLLDTSHHMYPEKNSSALSKSQPGKSSSSLDNLENTGRSKDKSCIRELPDLNLSVGKIAIHAPKSEHVLKKDGSSARTKITTLEKAIRELEKIVTESRPPTNENQEGDNTPQAVKRRLPREIKLKLDKVARLAQASQGKVSKDLINRLMSILGHLIQLRTLKRNLKIMISMGLSAKKEKDDRFQQIKKEVVEMIKMQAPSMESKLQQQAGASGEKELRPDGKAITKRIFSMDTTLEDRICDLYDLFVDGLDENAGPQIRKLYAELAELWPTGYMDNHGIKRAICRSKERRQALHIKHKDREKIKKIKLFPRRQDETYLFNANPITSQQPMRERLATDTSSLNHASVNKAVSNTVAAPRVYNPSLNGSKQEKAKGTSSGSLDDVMGADRIVIKKRVKRNLEQGLEGTHLDDVMDADRIVLKKRVKRNPEQGLEGTHLDDVIGADRIVLKQRVKIKPEQGLEGTHLDDVMGADRILLKKRVRRKPEQGLEETHLDDVISADRILLKKRVKRKPEQGLEGTHLDGVIGADRIVLKKRVRRKPEQGLEGTHLDDVMGADRIVLKKRVKIKPEQGLEGTHLDDVMDADRIVLKKRVKIKPEQDLEGTHLDDVIGANRIAIKKRVKRKPEQGLEGTHFLPEKMTAFLRGEKTSSLKQSAGVLPKSNLQPSSLHGLEQSS